MQANDAVASERSIFSENHDYKSFFRVAVFRGLYARGGRKLRTHTHGTTTVTLAARMRAEC